MGLRSLFPWLLHHIVTSNWLIVSPRLLRDWSWGISKEPLSMFALWWEMNRLAHSNENQKCNFTGCSDHEGNQCTIEVGGNFWLFWGRTTCGPQIAIVGRQTQAWIARITLQGSSWIEEYFKLLDYPLLLLWKTMRKLYVTCRENMDFNCPSRESLCRFLISFWMSNEERCYTIFRRNIANLVNNLHPCTLVESDQSIVCAIMEIAWKQATNIS
jgi:hypothetical protein